MIAADASRPGIHRMARSVVRDMRAAFARDFLGLDFRDAPGRCDRRAAVRFR
jgi:hypothetical protein